MGYRDSYNGLEIEDGAFVSVEGTNKKIVMPEGAVLIRYTGNEEKVVIPQGVSYIGSDAFEGNSNVKSIVIPDSVKIIESYAFAGCKKLESVIIPNTVTRICCGAFERTPWLEELKRESGNFAVAVNGVWIEPDSLFDSSHIRSRCDFYEYAIPKGVKRLPSSCIENDAPIDVWDDVLEDYSQRTLYITIPKSVLHIARDAFINDGIVIKAYRNSYAEYYASRHNIPFIALPTQSLNESMLNWTLNRDGTLQVFGSGEMPDFTDVVQPPWHKRRKEIKRIVVHNGITSIGSYSFKDCTELKAALIPNSIIEIKEMAFGDCCALSSIKIPDTVISIGNLAFCGCESLSNVILPSKLLRLGQGAFEECSGLSSINIPESLTEIEEETFYACNALTHITIPDTITYIGSKAFFASGLIEITLPKCLTAINELTFAYCLNLRKVVLPGEFKYNMNETSKIGEMAFFNCPQLTNIEIPFETTRIGKGAFATCVGLNNIVIPRTVDTIDDCAFYKCIKLQTVIFQFFTSGCTDIWRIGENAFAGCSALESIEIPDSVRRIDSEAFSDCVSLSDVRFSPQTQIGENAFANTPFEKNN